MTATTTHDRQDLIAALDQINQRLLWLSSWTIHHANHIRRVARR
jgi:pyruvate dehydrogenase E1 component